MFKIGPNSGTVVNATLPLTVTQPEPSANVPALAADCAELYRDLTAKLPEMARSEMVDVSVAVK